MPGQTAINDSQIRATAAEVEILANLIAGKAEELRKAFDQLYPNLHFAHPVKDKAFDRFMLTLARVKMMADELPSLAYQARLMREFHMPQRHQEEPVRSESTFIAAAALAPA